MLKEIPIVFRFEADCDYTLGEFLQEVIAEEGLTEVKLYQNARHNFPIDNFEAIYTLHYLGGEFVDAITHNWLYHTFSDGYFECVIKGANKRIEDGQINYDVWI